MRFLKFFILSSLVFALLGIVLVQWLAQKPFPETITYGMSFNTDYARELGLDWQETYDAILDDLGVRHVRLAAHWPMVEPDNNQWNFEELDYQIRRAEEVGAEVVLAVGRRLPRWPECHIPSWVRSYPREAKNAEVLSYVETVVLRYKDSPAVKIWQVENEPFLEVFAFEHCGKLDYDLLDAELALVRKLDPTRPVLVTDSGNLGTWYGAYSRGDIFGTSVYVYFWNPELGPFRTVLPPWAYRVKERLLALWYGERDTVLIELSVEPWLIAPVVETPLEIQFSRMDMQKFEDILAYARDTRYDRQYLWGAEWWYWLKVRHNHPDIWERGRLLFERPADDSTY
jgi:hypothetical protein